MSVYSLKQALRVQLNVKTAHAHTLFIKKSVILVCSGPGISFSKRAPLSFLRLTRTPDIHFLSSDSAVLLWNFKNWIRVLTAVSASQIATGTSSPEPSSVSLESSWRACLVRSARASVVMFLFFRVSLIVVKPAKIKKKLLLYFLKSLCRRKCNILSHLYTPIWYLHLPGEFKICNTCITDLSFNGHYISLKCIVGNQRAVSQLLVSDDAFTGPLISTRDTRILFYLVPERFLYW